MRRAPVQGEGAYWLIESQPTRVPYARYPGTISWAEHLEAFTMYAKRYGAWQSADDIAERGGFEYDELCSYLGREPETWKEV